MSHISQGEKDQKYKRVEVDQKTLPFSKKELAPLVYKMMEEAHLIGRLQKASGLLRPSKPTHPNAIEALREIVSGSEIKVFSFGEQHVQGDEVKFKTSVERYFEEIVPYLVREQGVMIFGNEHLPVGISAEIEKYLEKGESPEQTPYLYAILNFSTPTRIKQLQSILISVRELKESGAPINLEGVQDREMLRRQLMSLKEGAKFSGDDLVQTVKMFNVHSASLVRDALRKGQKVSLYNGSGHLEESDFPSPFTATHLPNLMEAGLKSEEYLPIHLVVPEQLTNLLAKDLLIKQKVPREGVVLRKTGRGYEIIFPSTPVIPKDSVPPAPPEINPQ
jgi:hypothetical protein